MKVCISSGHGTKIRGASSKWADEVDEAIRTMNAVAPKLRERGVEVLTFTDTVSTSQSANLDRICDWHNAQGKHDMDCSIHFNAFEETSTQEHGCEVLYVSDLGHERADEIVDAICSVSDLINRGPKERTDLAFLNNTETAGSVLIEVCFIDSKPDLDKYNRSFELICDAIAGAIAGEETESGPPPWIDRPTEPPAQSGLFHTVGTCSWFGGPDDDGVSPSEGLAFYYDVMDQPELFLPYQPAGTTGLARRLNPQVPYVACRWDYDRTPKEMLRSGKMALVRANGWEMEAFPADWGPHEEQTGRAADLSPGLMRAFGITTDDEVEVIYPAPEDEV